MAPKIIALILTLVTNLAIGVAVFFVMLVAMNGYNESDATYGLVVYGILALLVSLSMAVSAFFIVGRLIRREMNMVAATLIGTVVFSICGAVLKMVCGLLSVGVAELVRASF